MAVCDQQRCKRNAEVAPKLVVPAAVGAPFDKRRNIAVVLSLSLCRRCCLGIDPVRQAEMPNVAAFVRLTGRAQAKHLGLPFTEPDFARAKIEVMKIGSDEHRKIEPQLMAEHEKANEEGQP